MRLRRTRRRQPVLTTPLRIKLRRVLLQSQVRHYRILSHGEFCHDFLWAQFSSPPEHPYLAGVVGVPLTEMTRIFLFSAGLSRISRVIPHAVDTDVYRTSTSRNHRPPERRFFGGTTG